MQIDKNSAYFDRNNSLPLQKMYPCFKTYKEHNRELNLKTYQTLVKIFAYINSFRPHNNPMK